MRRKVKNKRVLQAMTIGLAAVIAASGIPMDVYAAESENGENGQNNPSTTSEPEETDKAVELIEGTEQDQDGAEDHIVNALDNVEIIATTGATELVDQDLVEKIQGELEDGTKDEDGNEVASAKEELGNAVVELGNAQTAFDNAEAAEIELVSELDTISEEQTKLDTASDGVDVNTSGVFDNVDIANNSDDKDTAYAAADTAKADLDKAESDLADADSAIDSLGKAKKAAEDAYKEAVDEYVAANEALDKVSVNSAAAYKQLTDAKADLEKLKKDTAAKKAALEKIEDQYYALQVQYYREVLGSEVVYSKDFDEKTQSYHLDVAACADKLAKKKDSDSIIEKKANSPGNPVMELSRYLMEEIVKYQIMYTEGVSEDDISFGVSGSAARNGREGLVFSNNSKQDQVVAKDKTQGGYNEKEDAEHKTYYMTPSSLKDNGRSNRFTVSYVKDGKTYTRDYNYILKNPNRTEDKVDGSVNIADGPIYLAVISDDGQIIRQSDEANVYDGYIELTKVLGAVAVDQAYTNAIKAVEDAQGRVNDLETEIANLKKVATDRSKLDKLYSELSEAEKELKDLESVRAELEDLVQKAREAYASIDLSRFNVSTEIEDTAAPSEEITEEELIEDEYVPVYSDEADDDAITGDTPIATDTLDVEATPVTFAAAATAALPAGGAIAGEGAVIADNQIPLDGGETQSEIASETEQKKEPVITKIQDNKTPTTNGNPISGDLSKEGVNFFNWLWLLFLAAVAATAKKIHDEKQKKAELKGQASDEITK